jgi:hypothetical protein
MEEVWMVKDREEDVEVCRSCGGGTLAVGRASCCLGVWRGAGDGRPGTAI